MPKGHYTITDVSDEGVPTLPLQAQAAFRRACASLARTKVRITYASWPSVPDNEKEFLWDTIKAQFDFPEGTKKAVERQAKAKMGKAWKTFKSELYNTYVKNDLMPYRQDPNTYGYLEDQWTEFVERCTSEEFVQRSQANKARQARNIHPHRLGTGEYTRKELDWNREDEQASQESRETPFSQIPERRARNWYRARADISADGTVAFRKPETVQVAQNILRLSEESSQGTFQAAREKDILTSALGNKEHPGRMRGVGVTVPWKLGFPDDAGS